MSEQIKPCPHCGGEAILTEHPPHKHFFANLPDHEGSWDVSCPRCGSGMIDGNKDAVVARWNMRVAEATKTQASPEYFDEQGRRLFSPFVDCGTAKLGTEKPVLAEPVNGRLLDALKGLMSLADHKVDMRDEAEFARQAIAEAESCGSQTSETETQQSLRLTSDTQRRLLDAEKLAALLSEIRPCFGAVGSRDVDVRRQQEIIDEALSILAEAEGGGDE